MVRRGMWIQVSFGVFNDFAPSDTSRVPPLPPRSQLYDIGAEWPSNREAALERAADLSRLDD
eukprot:8179498-Pyramimonas_sp.AAC.2